MQKLVLASFLGLVACADPPAAGRPPTTKKDVSSTTPAFGGADDESSPTGVAAGQPNEVWGHSADTLYSVDPVTKAVKVVGAFSGCTGDVMDIALDGESKLFATTRSALWSVDKATAACTKIASGDYPNSLSFVPKGTVDPDAEALVGYELADYVRIDTKTGRKTTIGRIGGGLESSGDIVSVKGGATYLSVTGTGCEESDCLIEVNPSTGALVKNWGSIGRSDVFGLAFWAGSVYGFDNAGELFEVSFEGGTLATKSIPLSGAEATTSFWGAGSTTSAPVTSVK
jgi:hypothetical protein